MFAATNDAHRLPPSDNRSDRGARALPTPAAQSALRRFVVSTLIGAGLGLIIVLALLRWMRFDPTPALTPEIFAAARDRWRATAPPSYDIEVRVTGSQPATYRVRVRDGQAENAWRNGRPLTSRRTFSTWSVPGMFGTISRDIEAVERVANGQADRFTPHLRLRAEFEERYSYPKRYRRIEEGSNIEVAWEVTQFDVSP